MGNNGIIQHKNEYLFSDELLPIRQHQAYDEVLQKERELAGSVYYQRCLEKDL